MQSTVAYAALDNGQLPVLDISMATKPGKQRTTAGNRGVRLAYYTIVCCYRDVPLLGQGSSQAQVLWQQV
jgi:hypothetical protein